MAKRKKKRKINFISILIILLSIIYALYEKEINESFGLEVNTTFNESSNLYVSFLDVGQADSILIENNNEFMLIDAGNNNDGSLLVDYFRSKNITNFKYVVGTHPHEDHIGGLDDIIDNFYVSNVYLPDVITTTKTFSDVLDAIEDKNLKYKVPLIGEYFTIGDAKVRVVYTGSNEKDLNNSSIVLKLTFGNNSFLFTGDAEEKIEKLILNTNIDADVLKVGHHGSSYSTSSSFLKAVNPKYAIISVGEENNYNHPNDSVIKKLNSNNIQIYCTDEVGSVIVTSDGNNISIENKRTNTNGG